MRSFEELVRPSVLALNNEPIVPRGGLKTLHGISAMGWRIKHYALDVSDQPSEPISSKPVAAGAWPEDPHFAKTESGFAEMKRVVDVLMAELTRAGIYTQSDT